MFCNFEKKITFVILYYAKSSRTILLYLTVIWDIIHIVNIPQVEPQHSIVYGIRVQNIFFNQFLIFLLRMNYKNKIFLQVQNHLFRSKRFFLISPLCLAFQDDVSPLYCPLGCLSEGKINVNTLVITIKRQSTVATDSEPIFLYVS